MTQHTHNKQPQKANYQGLAAISKTLESRPVGCDFTNLKRGVAMNGNCIMRLAWHSSEIDWGNCEGNDRRAWPMPMPCLELQNHLNYVQSPSTIEIWIILQRCLIWISSRLGSNLTSQYESIERNQQSWFLVFLKSPLSSRTMIRWDYLIVLACTYNMRASSGLTIWLTTTRMTVGKKLLRNVSAPQGFLIQKNVGQTIAHEDFQFSARYLMHLKVDVFALEYYSKTSRPLAAANMA